MEFGLPGDRARASAVWPEFLRFDDGGEVEVT